MLFVSNFYLASLRVLAGAELGSRAFQVQLDVEYTWVRGSEQAPRSPFYVLEYLHRLAEIVERRAVVIVEHLRFHLLHRERDLMTFTENTLRQGCRFAQQRSGFFEALQNAKQVYVVIGRRECSLTISRPASHASRRVVGQWGGAGGACCEDHFCLVWGGLRVARVESW